MLALVVVLRQLASLNSQETTEQQQGTVESQQGVQEPRSAAVTFVGDVFSARIQVDDHTFQVGEENEPEQHYQSLNTDEDSNGLKQSSVADLFEG